MYRLPKNIDLSFFVGKTLNSVAFAVNVIHLIFDDGVRVNIESTFQYQQKHEQDHHLLGTMQSVYKIQSSGLMQLAGQIVVAASGTEDGTLSLIFENGHMLHCFDDLEGYECYNFTDGKQLWVV